MDMNALLTSPKTARVNSIDDSCMLVCLCLSVCLFNITQERCSDMLVLRLVHCAMWIELYIHD